MTFSMPSLTSCWAAAASPFAWSIASAETVDEVADDVGVLVEELRGDDQVGGDELAVGPQLGLVEQHGPAALLDEPVAHGSGTHAPSIAPDWNAASVSALSCGVIAHVAAAAGVGLEPLLGEPCPQGDVLGVAERRVASVAPARSAGESMPSRRRARRRPTSCRPRCAAPRRWTWRSR